MAHTTDGSSLDPRRPVSTPERTLTPPRGLRAVSVPAPGGEFAVLEWRAPLLSPQLTAAEAHVAALLLEGRSNPDIAALRGSSVHTVANQIESIFHKLGCRSRSELLARVHSGAAGITP